MAVTTCEEVQSQDAYNISIVSEKEISSPRSHLNFQEISKQIESRACVDPQWDCKNCTVLQIGNVDRISPCVIDLDVKKDTLEAPGTDDRTVGSLTRTESSVRRASRRKISLQLGEKIMRLLMNNNIMLLKCTSGDKAVATEKAPDTPTSRWRRYRRAASFDSRKVVLLFSLLSSFGTLVLIYLTLRVKQIDEGAHV